MNINKKLDINHIMIHSAFQMMAGIVYGFGVYMLMSRGFDSSKAGLCISLANLFSIIVQPTVSNFLDKSKKISVFTMLVICSLIISMMFLANVLIASKSILLIIIFVLGSGLYSSCEPLVNSLSNIFVTNGIHIEFGLARSIGSLSYGTTCVLFGILSDKFNIYSVLIGGFIISMIFTISCLLMNINYKKTNINIFAKKETNNVGLLDFIKGHKPFIILCIFLIGVFANYTCVDNFLLLVVENVGGTSADMGIILGIKAGLEAIAIFFFSKIIKKFDLNKVLIFSAFMFAVKTLAICLAQDKIVIYLSQLFQMFSFALLLPGMVEFVYRKMNQNEAIRGQAFFTMTIGLGSIVSSYLGGLIANNWGIVTMEYVSLVVGVISAIGFTIFIYKQ